VREPPQPGQTRRLLEDPLLHSHRVLPYSPCTSNVLKSYNLFKLNVISSDEYNAFNLVLLVTRFDPDYEILIKAHDAAPWCQSSVYSYSVFEITKRKEPKEKGGQLIKQQLNSHQTCPSSRYSPTSGSSHCQCHCHCRLLSLESHHHVQSCSLQQQEP